MRSRYETARRILVFWTLFIGIGAVGGAAMMLLDPTGKTMGMDGMLPYFQVLPFAEVVFQDLAFSGIALFIVNGLTNLAAAGLLLARKKAGVVLGGIFGVTLMLWICIQFYIFPPNFMSTIYFIFGFCQAATGYAAWVFRRQESFTVNMADYPHIGSDPTRLVIYFSRMGYGKKLACEEAERTGAALYEVRSSERTEGTLGFWWCGRYGMHRWAMPIRPVEIDLSACRHVTIVSPIWVFALAAPCAASARQPPEKSGRWITSWCTTPADGTKIPPKRWTRCWGFATPGCAVTGAAWAPSKRSRNNPRFGGQIMLPLKSRKNNPPGSRKAPRLCFCQRDGRASGIGLLPGVIFRHGTAYFPAWDGIVSSIYCKNQKPPGEQGKLPGGLHFICWRLQGPGRGRTPCPWHGRGGGVAAPLRAGEARPVRPWNPRPAAARSARVIQGRPTAESVPFSAGLRQCPPAGKRR